VTFECEIRNGQGMRVLPRQLPGGVAQPPFSRYQGLISRAPIRRPGFSTDGEPERDNE
jgi:hypothetical protein